MTAISCYTFNLHSCYPFAAVGGRGNDAMGDNSTDDDCCEWKNEIKIISKWKYINMYITYFSCPRIAIVLVLIVHSKIQRQWTKKES